MGGGGGEGQKGGGGTRRDYEIENGAKVIASPGHLNERERGENIMR